MGVRHVLGSAQVRDPAYNGLDYYYDFPRVHTGYGHEHVPGTGRPGRGVHAYDEGFAIPARRLAC